MALYTLLLCLGYGNTPYVRFMAFHAFHSHRLDMYLVFSYPKLVSVASYKAVAPVRPYFCMRLMTFIAEELHGAICGKIYLFSHLNSILRRHKVFYIDRIVMRQCLSVFITPVTIKTFFASRLKVYGPVCVAVKTGEFFHSHAMHLPVLVAGKAVSFLERKFMCSVSVAFRAFHLLHKYMLCMVS